MRSSAFLGLLLSLALGCSEGGSSDVGSVAPGAAAGSGQAGATAAGGSATGGSATGGSAAGGSAAGASSAGAAGASGAAGGGGKNTAGGGAGGSAAGAAGAAGGGGGAGGGACCGSDQECQDKGLVRCIEGECRGPLPEGQCWDGKDCIEGLVCVNQAPCPCGLLCDQDSPGACVLPVGVCCTKASDCGGQGLVDPHCVEGICKALPQTMPGKQQCWLDGDCDAGKACVGVLICACGLDACDAVPDAPGVCELVTLPEGKCHKASDCKSFEYCAPAGTSPGCGVCMQPPSPCASDADCASAGDAFICGQDQCVCGDTCIPGCKSDGDCGLGRVCTPGHHCTTQGCSTDKDCPTNFRCNTQPESGVCERRPCDSDGDCTGYCVEGVCHEDLGVCLAPAA